MFLLGLTLRTTIYCGVIKNDANAQIPGNDVSLIAKLEGISLTERLMNKVTHRSWGEDFMNIYLDLSIYISHSSSIFACPRVARIVVRARLVRKDGY
jgi:hypothetical protein